MPNESTIFKVCTFLRNWFDKYQVHYIGKIEIVNGALSQTYGLKANQYFRIIGSSSNNDGVHRYPVTTLTDEVFDGAIWGMNINSVVLDIMARIEAWEAKYSNANSNAMSPFTSESIPGVYSYSKPAVGENSGSGICKGVFDSELELYRKL